MKRISYTEIITAYNKGNGNLIKPIARKGTPMMKPTPIFVQVIGCELCRVEIVKSVARRQPEDGEQTKS